MTNRSGPAVEPDCCNFAVRLCKIAAFPRSIRIQNWCARQESNLLPCGPEFYEVPFELSALSSLRAAECRRLAGFFAPIAVRWPARQRQVGQAIVVDMSHLLPA